MKNQAAKVAKEAKSAVLRKLCDQIDDIKRDKGNDRIPYGFVAEQVKAMEDVCPWITRNSIMNFYRKQTKKKPVSTAIVPVEETAIVPVEESVIILREETAIVPREEAAIVPWTETAIVPVKQSGRPKGTTNKRKRIKDLALISTKNEIALKYDEEMKELRTANVRMKKG